MGQDLQVLQGAPKVAENDKVVINLEEKIVKIMQFQHGGWCDDMGKYIGKKGKVVKIDSDGDVVIKFNDGQRYIYNPNAVAKILSRGDSVKITENQEKAEFLQQGHGGWNSRMKKILGKEAKVKRVFKTYDVTVKVNSDTWCLNPLLCTVIKKNEGNSSSDDDSDEDMFFKMFNRAAKEAMDQFFQMDIPGMREFILNSDLVDSSFLHYSVYNENEKMTELILESGADINKTDDDGDTALHIAAMRRNPKIIRLLVNKGAKVDILNKKKHAPIHIAVLAESLECVKELWNSSINVKDGDGNNPLILAVMKKEYDILDHLLTHQNIDLTQKNKKGFNAFHMAAGIGDFISLEKIWKKKTDIVDEQKVDGYSALHLTVVNDKLEAAKFLIQKAKAKLDIKTDNESTPLMLAAHHGNLKIVKLLVTEGADINAQDDDGNTSLHLAINRKTGPALLLEMFMKTSLTKAPDAVDVVIFLVENGASLFIQNKKKKTPLDMITDDKLKADLQKRAKSSHHTPEEMCCMICSETKKLVKFQPCGHMKLCVDCSNANKSIKKCMQCKNEITDRIQPKTEEKKKEYNLKSLFKLGDRVCISMNEDLFIEKEAKENPKMKELLKKIGSVIKTEDDKIEVMFKDRSYSFLPEMLTKVFSSGDEVEVLKDVELVKTLQKDHGDWTEEMNEIIGKTGEVMQIERKMITVKFDTKLYHLNPMTCVWQRKPEQETNDSDPNRCVSCNQKTVEMTPLQCGHYYCSKCKHIGKCKFC